MQLDKDTASHVQNCKMALVLLTWMLAAHQVIAEKLLDYLRTTTDDAQKADVAKRIGELAERFAPDTQWFIDTMNQVSWLPPSYCSSKAFSFPHSSRADASSFPHSEESSVS